MSWEGNEWGAALSWSLTEAKRLLRAAQLLQNSSPPHTGPSACQVGGEKWYVPAPLQMPGSAPEPARMPAQLPGPRPSSRHAHLALAPDLGRVLPGRPAPGKEFTAFPLFVLWGAKAIQQLREQTLKCLNLTFETVVIGWCHPSILRG